ncbi:exonuclease IX [Salmonella enterica subsp. enterica serovar Enteritidis]|nr:exonuclease IX [Salmonella enterica subsp. enterica serovar Enteritidis]
MTTRAAAAGVISVYRTTKQDVRRCLTIYIMKCPPYAPHLNSAAYAVGHQTGNEADDLAATLALKVTEAGHQATIVSTDKGYCQLLSPGLRIRDYFQKRWLDAPFIEKEFGVLPRQLPDYWGLAGISSSKVPGVAGIGPKSATQLLIQFQNLEGIYAHLDEVPEKWRKKA